MKQIIRVAILLCLFLQVVAGLSAQSARLSGANMMLDSNTLDIHLRDDGKIDFIKATFYPGEGICNIYSLDIAENETGIHGQGVATSKTILKSGPSSYTVKSKSPIQAVVTIGPSVVTIVIGDEHYRISKTGKDFSIDIRPLLKDRSPSREISLAYNINPGKTPSFEGFSSLSYVPDYSYPRKLIIDDEANYVPKRMVFTKGTLDAYTYDTKDGTHPEFQYTYQFPFSADKQVNLDNYLILLTQRQADGMIPLIHPVLLTIYFFDSIMP